MWKALPHLILLAAAGVALFPGKAPAMCIPFFCEECDLKSNGQMNWVVMDRERGRVEIVPNIRITGSADDFALLVPTPSEPQFLAEVVTVWNEALSLTAAVTVAGGDGGMGCGGTVDFQSPAAGPPDTDALDVVRTETVGNFIATVIRSDDPGALVEWLGQNGFTIDPGDEARFAPYVEDDWFFTAFKLDTDAVEPPPTWDTNVDPVRIVFDADALEVPLPILSIHRSDSFPMVFFVVDDHRTDLEGFQTVYGNRITEAEAKAIADRFPGIAPDLRPGRFLTRLDRRFGPEDAMPHLALEQSPSDSEFRRILRTGFGSFPLALTILLGMLILTRPVLIRRS